MSQLRPHVTAFALVSWDGRAVTLEKSGGAGAAAGRLGGVLEAEEMLEGADAVLLDVSTGPGACVDSALALFAARGQAAETGKRGPQGVVSQASWSTRVLECVQVHAFARGGALAGARAREARLEPGYETPEPGDALRSQGGVGAGVVYSTTQGTPELLEVLGGAVELRCGGGGALDVGEMMRSLAFEFGVRRLGLHGGGALLGELLKAGCVDALWLNFSPQIIGNNRGETLSGPVGSFLPASSRASLIEMKQVGGECFTKWSLKPAALRKRVLRKS